jgi:hypothetical protein
MALGFGCLFGFFEQVERTIALKRNETEQPIFEAGK